MALDVVQTVKHHTVYRPIEGIPVRWLTPAHRVSDASRALLDELAQVLADEGDVLIVLPEVGAALEHMPPLIPETDGVLINPTIVSLYGDMFRLHRGGERVEQRPARGYKV